MLVKYLLVLLVVGIGLWMLTARLRADRRRDQNRQGQRPPEQKKQQLPDMVACAKCGLHLPAVDALYQGPTPYCCAVHRDSGPDKPKTP